MFRTHFEEKVTLLKFAHNESCVFAKMLIFIICGKNLIDACNNIFSDRCIRIECIGLDPALIDDNIKNINI